MHQLLLQPQSTVLLIITFLWEDMPRETWWQAGVAPLQSYVPLKVAAEGK